jgi:3-deoxy-D-manno-octulosonic-acid transferase
MNRRLYSLLWWLALPAVVLALLWRALTRPRYRAYWWERFGFSTSPGSAHKCPVWIHAVSVGETRAAQPLIQALLDGNSVRTILLTHMTPTGRATGESLYAKHVENGRLIQAYLPYDYGVAMRAFMTRWQPSLAIMMETEVWPNLIATAHQMAVPIALVNARLSEKSLNKGLGVKALMCGAVQGFDAIAAQSGADADRIRRFGPRVPVQVVGSTKFDVVVPQVSVALGERWKAAINRPAIVFASSRDGEEAIFFRELRRKLDEKLSRTRMTAPLAMVVPRHPERFDEVEALATKHGFTVARRSAGMDTASIGTTTANILLGDSMGEMFAYYCAADVAIIGGSFGAFGSQNLLEAMAVGCPVIVGPSRFNFDHIISEALQSGGAIGVIDMKAAIDSAFDLLGSNDDRTRLSKAAQQFCAAHQGATQRTLDILSQWL